jgi:Tol biopolymer transport system component
MLVWLIIALLSAALLNAQGDIRAVFERARLLDEKNSELAEAIRLYGEVAEQGKGQRPLAARALYRQGLLHARLGHKDEAARSWRKVIVDFPEQTAIVRLARAKLNPRAPKSNGVRQYRVSGAEAFARVHPDGRLMLFTDESNGNLAIRDLLTGESRRLTRKRETWAQSWAQAMGGIFSPDGKETAYQWMNAAGAVELRRISLDGSGDRRIHDCSGLARCTPLDWSNDRRRLLFQRDSDARSDLALLDLETGRVDGVPLRRAMGGSAFFSRTAPGVVATLTQDDGQGSDIFHIAADGAETPLVRHPANENALAWTSEGRLLFASDRLRTGSLWLLDPNQPSETAASVINQQVGWIAAIGITRSGTLFYFAPSQTSDIYAAELDVNSGAVLRPPAPLPLRWTGRNTFATWSPDGASLLFHAGSNASGTRFAIYSKDSGTTRELTADLMNAATPQWTPDGRSIFVFGRQRSGLQGHHTVDLATGAASLLFARELTESTMHGAWTPDGRYYFNRPNKWQQGIYRLEAGGLSKTTLYVPPPGVSIGLDNISPSPDGRWLAFHAATVPWVSSSLMLIPVEGGEAKPLLTLREPERFTFGAFTWTPDSKSILVARGVADRFAIWAVPLDGSAARRTALEFPAMRMPRLNPDGKSLAFFAGSGWGEIWALENFLPEPTKK